MAVKRDQKAMRSGFWSTAVVAAWLIALAFLGFYVYGLVLSVFSPVELWGFTVLAVAIIVAFPVHAIRVRRALRHSGNPNHDNLVHSLMEPRERRGY